MFRRIWRAFWTAMREPARAYGTPKPPQKMTLLIDVDAVEAHEKLDALIAKAKQLRALTWERPL